ncbi:MAG: hypothetical protein IMY72_05605 [Bacteroidetes bacterium]|nr:hypothetical protein [Bacteroidota bacterium]
MKKYLLVILLILGFESFGSTLNVETKTFKNGRTIRVCLPEKYTKFTLKLPVIYVFDGQILFNYIIGLYEYNFDKYPPAIIVGIEQLDRGNEFIKQKEDSAKKTFYKFEDFITKELIQYIDSNYRTNSIKIGIGHSHGGTFLLNNLLLHKTFTVGICVSPTLWTNKYAIFQNYQAIKNKSDLSFQLYLAYGENDFSAIKKGVCDFNQMLLSDSTSKIISHVDEYKGEDHNSAILVGSRKGLNYIFKDYVFPENKWDLMEESANDSMFYTHYKKLSKKLNCQIIPLEDDYNSLGYFYLELNKIDKAMEIFKKSMIYYPYSSNVYDSYADALEKKGELKKAYKFCQKALKLELKTDNNSFQIEQYKGHLTKLEKALGK